MTVSEDAQKTDHTQRTIFIISIGCRYEKAWKYIRDNPSVQKMTLKIGYPGNSFTEDTTEEIEVFYKPEHIHLMKDGFLLIQTRHGGCILHTCGIKNNAYQ